MKGKIQIIGLGLGLKAGCIDYGMKALEEEGLTKFEDCTDVVGGRYWFEDHEFGAVVIYGNCEPASTEAYLLIEHELLLMDALHTTATYTTENADVITTDAVQFTFDFWYNPADIELSLVPFSGDTILGIHEFWVDCADDDTSACDIDYTRGVGSLDFE